MECQHAMNLTLKAVKAILPEKAIVTKDAKTKLNTAATMFTLYLSATAQEICHQNKRQTITSRDVLQALREMDFEQFQEPVESYLRESKQQKKATKKPAQVQTSEKEIVDTSNPNGSTVADVEDLVGLEDRNEGIDTEEDADVVMEEENEESHTQDHENESSTMEDDHADGIEEMEEMEVMGESKEEDEEEEEETKEPKGALPLTEKSEQSIQQLQEEEKEENEASQGDGSVGADKDPVEPQSSSILESLSPRTKQNQPQEDPAGATEPEQ